jgi:GntR family transcriptional repressor for pyruvate dehydrogenase complex
MLDVFSPIRKSRISEEIADQIRGLIAEGRFAPGDRLPPEREMADTLRVSRNSVRDALRTLEVMGIVERRHGDGVYVSCITAETLVAPLASILATKQTLVDELMDARRLLEPPVARCSAERATDEDIAELEGLLEAQTAKTRAGSPAFEEHNAFHFALARSTKNEIVLLVINHVIDLLKESRAAWSLARAQRSVVGHRRILDAIRSRQPEAAFAAMLEHLDELETASRKAPEQGG